MDPLQAQPNNDQAIQAALLKRALVSGAPNQIQAAPQQLPSGAPASPGVQAPAVPTAAQAPRNLAGMSGDQDSTKKNVNTLLKSAVNVLGSENLDPGTEQLTKALITRALQYH